MLFSKKSFTLKKITNLNKKTQQFQVNSQEEKEEKLIDNEIHENNPEKFLDPFPFHLFVSNFIIYDKLYKIPGDFVSPMNTLFNLKYVVSIDSFEKYLWINFEENVSYPISPPGFLITRLRSMNDQDAFQLSNLIESYHLFFDSMATVQKNGANREVLDSLNPFFLKLLQQYYSAMMSSLIEEENFPNFLDVLLDKYNDRCLFCLINNEFKPMIGMQLSGFFMNNFMRNSISLNEFELINTGFVSIEKAEYFEQYLKTLKNIFTLKEGETFDFIVRCRNGNKKKSFLIKKWYLNLKKGGRKILVVFSEVVANDKKSIYLPDSQKLLKNQSEIDSGDIEKNLKWKKLVNLYFGNGEEEIIEEKQLE